MLVLTNTFRVSARAVASVVLCAVWGVASIAHAEATVALEIYVDDGTGDDGLHLAEALKSHLEARGVLTRTEPIMQAIGDDLPHPGNPQRDVTRSQLIERIERGVRAASHEAYEEATTILESALRDIDNNPALSASDPKARSWVTKARVALAVAHNRRKKPELASRVIADHVRCYPDISLEGEQQEVEALYLAAKAAAVRTEQGILTFRVDRKDAAIFVDDLLVGKAGFVSMPLLSGEHRVVVRAEGVYRGYRARIRPRETLSRAVRWSADAAFVISPARIGFARPGVDGAAFIRDLVERRGDRSAVGFGVVSDRGRRYLVARRYNPRPSKEVPGAAIDLRHATDELVEALAAHVAAPTDEGRLPRGLVPIPGEVSAAASHDVVVRTAASHRRWPAVAALGVFVVTLPTAAYLAKREKDCRSRGWETAESPCSSALLPATLTTAAIAGVALTFGVAWIVEGGPSPRRVRVSVEPRAGGGIAQLSGVF